MYENLYLNTDYNSHTFTISGTDVSHYHDPCTVIENNYSGLPKRGTKIIFLIIVCGTTHYAVGCAYDDRYATFIIQGYNGKLIYLYMSDGVWNKVYLHQ